MQKQNLALNNLQEVICHKTNQPTNYHNSINQSGYHLWFEMLWSCDRDAANKHVLSIYCKTFDSP